MFIQTKHNLKLEQHVPRVLCELTMTYPSDYASEQTVAANPCMHMYHKCHNFSETYFPHFSDGIDVLWRWA